MGNDNTLDLAWAAGFFDGEGTIGVYKRGGAGYSLASAIAQVDPAPLHQLVAMFGGSLNRYNARTGHRAHWVLTWTSLRAAAALRAMLPFLTVKRGQAGLAIAFQSIIRTLPAGRPRRLNGWEIAERQSFAEALVEAKHVEFE